MKFVLYNKQHTRINQIILFPIIIQIFNLFKIVFILSIFSKITQAKVDISSLGCVTGFTMDQTMER